MFLAILVARFTMSLELCGLSRPSSPRILLVVASVHTSWTNLLGQQLPFRKKTQGDREEPS